MKMLELIAYEYLSAELDVPVVFSEPTVPEWDAVPERYVLIKKLSEKNKNHLRSGSLALKSYARNVYDAAVLDRTVRDAADRMIELDGIASAKLSSSYDSSDTTRKVNRYQSVYDFVFYDEAQEGE